MNDSITQAFVGAITHTFDVLLGCKITVVDISTDAHSCPLGQRVYGTIGFSGSGSGAMVLGMEPAIALRATEILIGDSHDELDADVLDTVAELTNIVAGCAKSYLKRSGLSLALPSVVIGNCGWSYKASNHAFIECSCEWGELTIKLAMDLPQSTDCDHDLVSSDMLML